MTAAGATLGRRQWPELVRWLVCFTLALFFHVAGAVVLMARWQDDLDAVASAPIILVDLAPLAVAPQTQPTELPPGPLQTESKTEPEPEKAVSEIEPMSATPEPLLAMTPPLKPPEKTEQKRERRVDLTSAPSPAERQAERTAAPMPGAAARDSTALPNWKSLLVAQLERHKRYPEAARARGESGVAQLAFSIDRHGGVHGARIARSSGSTALDQETLAMVQRAQPLPPPPPEIAGAQIAIVVPIRYNIR